MIQPEEVRQMIKKLFPEGEVNVDDQTGTLDHFEIRVASPRFTGKRLIEQHQMVQAALEEAMADGRIHAVQIKTVVP